MAKREGDMAFAALRSFMWKHKWSFFPLDIARALSSVFVAIHPYLFGKLATSINDKDAAFKYLILLLLSGMAHGLIWHIADYGVVRKINPLFIEFKKIAFDMFWDKDYKTYIEKPSGKVGYYINQFRGQLWALYDAYHYSFISIATALPIYIFLLYRAAWQNSIIYTVFLVITFSLLIYLAKSVEKYQRLFTDAESTNSGRIFDSYANFVNVFSFRAHRKEIARNDEQLNVVTEKYKAADYRVMNYWTAAAFMMRYVLWSAILLYSWYMYDKGKISFPELIVSVTVLIDFTQQFWHVVHQIGSWNRNSSTFRESYNYLFPNQNAVKDFFTKKRRYDKHQDVCFENKLEVKNLDFAYPDAPNKKVLTNINFTVNKNEKIGIVGKSGSGKSTLIKILLGFYDIDKEGAASGQIAVDNIDVHSADLSQLYAYVPQDTTLFQETIFYNIAYASDEVPTMSQVQNAAKKAHIDEFIDNLPLGYETLVGERGVKLSLGQRQRIAIARAFLKKSDLLILDEATSALDSKTESYVQESFEKLWEGKSVIAIAHRLSTLNNVDRIIVMSKGEIVEEGTKEELLALDGHFADLWNHQRKGMI